MLFRLTSGPHGLETFSEEITFAFKCETQKRMPQHCQAVPTLSPSLLGHT